MSNQITRCQQCGQPIQGHGVGCYPVEKPSHDQSQEHLSLVDDAAGELLRAIMKHRSIQMLQGCTYANEFFQLLDLRRKL